MPDQELKFTLVFNSQTGDLQVVQDKLEGVSEAAQGVGNAAAVGAKTAEKGMQDVGKAATEAFDSFDMAAKTAEKGGNKAAEGMNKAGDAAKHVKKEGGDALEHIGKKVEHIAMGIFVAQLAIEGFKKIAAESAPLQGLQETIEDVAGTLMKDLEPALSLISQGLQGLVLGFGAVLAVAKPTFETIIDFLKADVDIVTTLIGAAVNLVQGNVRGAYETIKGGVKDVKGEFKGLDSSWEAGLHTGLERLKEAGERAQGETKKFTKAMAAAREAEINSRVAHNAAVAKISLGAVEDEMKVEGISQARKMALVKKQEKIELDTMRTEQAAKVTILRDKLATRQVTQQQFDSQLLVIQQDTADKSVAIEDQAAREKKSIEREHTKTLIQQLQQQSAAMADAAAQEILISGNVAQGLRAAGAAEINELGNLAASKIEMYGAMAAAAAFEKAASSAPPYLSVAAGVAAAAPVLLWYTALATGVKVASGALAGAVGGGGGGGSMPNSSDIGSGGGGSSSAASSKDDGSGNAANSSAPARRNSGGSSGGGGGGPMTLNLTVNLNGEAILRLVQAASFNGDIQISADAITH